jgi:hypothetical protein
MRDSGFEINYRQDRDAPDAWYSLQQGRHPERCGPRATPDVDDVAESPLIDYATAAREFEVEGADDDLDTTAGENFVAARRQVVDAGNVDPIPDDLELLRRLLIDGTNGCTNEHTCSCSTAAARRRLAEAGIEVPGPPDPTVLVGVDPSVTRCYHVEVLADVPASHDPFAAWRDLGQPDDVHLLDDMFGRPGPGTTLGRVVQVDGDPVRP